MFFVLSTNAIYIIANILALQLTSYQQSCSANILMLLSIVNPIELRSKRRNARKLCLNPEIFFKKKADAKITKKANQSAKRKDF